MTRFFMVEPGVLVAEQRPGTHRFDDTVQRPPARPVRSVEELRRQYAEQAPQSPQEGTGQPIDFVAAVDRLVKLGVSYGDACRQVSMEFPDLYEAHREWSLLDG